MKTHIFLIGLAAAAMTGFASCDNEEAAVPEAKIEIEKNPLEVNESMEVRFVGAADNVVVYPGDTGHDYDLRNESNSGLVVNKGLFTYSYTTPGIYKVVCVATNHAQEGSIVLTDTCSMYVKVIDDCTEIERLSAPQVLYDEVFAEPLNTTDWLMPLPRKIRFKTSNPAVSMSQKLKFYIASTSTRILIDGEDFNSGKKYDLNVTHDVRTLSDEGTYRDYRLYTLNYGEFESFSVAGAEATVERSEFDYSHYEINLKVPGDTDLSSLKPVFTLFSGNEKVYVGETPQISGETAVDFTSPVTYRFIVTHPENPSVTLESECVVTISK